MKKNKSIYIAAIQIQNRIKNAPIYTNVRITAARLTKKNMGIVRVNSVLNEEGWEEGSI